MRERLDKISEREFAKICLASAQGQDVSGQIQSYLDRGVSLDRLAQQVDAHRVTALLAKPLDDLQKSKGLKIFLSPPFYLSRNMMIKAQLKELDRALHKAGLSLLLLKGSTQLFRSAYLSIGMRQMSDVDVLVNDERILDVFKNAGYVPRYSSEKFPDSFDIPKFKNHLAPIWLDGGLVTVEMHLAPVMRRYQHLVSNKLFEQASVAPDTTSLLIPSSVDQLHIAIIHTMKHDRGSMHGALFNRSLVECELFFRALSDSEKERAKSEFIERGGGKVWSEWRDLASWCFDTRIGDTEKAKSASLVVTEYELRGSNKANVLVIALLYRLVSVLRIETWSSGEMVSQIRQFFGVPTQLKLWKKVTEIFRA